jgi:hypothetical protein
MAGETLPHQRGSLIHVFQNYDQLMGSCRLVDQCCSDALTRHGRKWVPSCTAAARRNDRSTARPAPWSCCNLNLTRFREPAASQHFSITQRIEGQRASNFRAHPTLARCKPNPDEHAIASIKGGRGSQPNIRNVKLAHNAGYAATPRRASNPDPHHYPSREDTALASF